MAPLEIANYEWYFFGVAYGIVAMLTLWLVVRRKK